MTQVYLNNQLVEETEAHVHTNDAGFLYGAGLFETMRCHQGTVFFLKDHLDRFFFSAGKLGLTIPKDRQEISTALNEVLAANDLENARIRLTLSAGRLSADGQGIEPTLLITAVPFTPYPEAYYQKGVLAVLCPWRQNPADPLAGHKTTNYFARMLALQQAHQKRATEAIWFTLEGYLAEGCVSNVFLVTEGKILTPPLETPVLAGVARQTVCRLAVGAGMPLQERGLVIDDLLGAQEVFLTNVIMQVLPVSGIEQHTVGDGQVGPVTRQLQGLYQETLEDQCGSTS